MIIDHKMHEITQCVNLVSLYLSDRSTCDVVKQDNSEFLEGLTTNEQYMYLHKNLDNLKKLTS